MRPMSRSGRVVRAAGGFYDVALGDEVVRCTMRGRLKRDKRRTDLCVVGDMVEVDIATFPLQAEGELHRHKL